MRNRRLSSLGVLALALALHAPVGAESPTVQGSQPGVSVTFSWKPPATVVPTGYKLYYGPGPGRYTTARDVGSATQATIEHLPPGQTVYVAATAYDATGESVYSNEVVVTPTIGVVIGPPEQLTVQSPTRGHGEATDDKEQ